MSRRTLLALGVLLSILGLAVSITGGFAAMVLDLRVSARSPRPAAIAAAAVLGVWLVLAWRARRICEDLTSVHTWLVAHAETLVIGVAALAGAVAIHYFSFSAGSSDPSGYLSQAAMLHRGQLLRGEPLAALADWPDAATTLAPLGWRPAIEPGLQVPTYAVGLPLLLAPLHAVGGLVVSTLIVPASFALAIWATGGVALRTAGPLAAIVAAVWLATSPVALIEAMQPMSDVPASAAWLVCWMMLLRHARGPTPGVAFAAGLAGAIAVLIRPNLAPLALIPAAFVAFRSGTRLGSVIAYSAPVAIAGLIVGSLQWRWFGSPLRSGYGSASEIYALATLAPNLATYGRWLLTSHGVWLFFAPIAVVWPWRFNRGSASHPIDANAMRWLLVFAAGVIAAYLFYNVFDVWTYLRFMLPALALAMVAVAAMIVWLVSWLPVAARAPTLVVVTLTLAASNVVAAQAHGVFRFAAVQSRAALAGHYLAATLPSNAVVIAGEQSGSVRYYTNRSIVRWDLAAEDGLDPICARLENLGLDIWIALDAWEEEPFRRKFPGSAAGALDWPPRAEAGTAMLMRAWRLRDREPFMRGERVVTDRLR